MDFVDFVFLAGIVLFCALTMALAVGCDRLGARK